MTASAFKITEGDDGNSRTMSLTADVGNMEEVLSFLDGFLEEKDCSLKVQSAFDIAMDEIFSNICYYAYAGRPEAEGKGEAEITVKYLADKPGFEVIFKDWGIPYNPLEKPDPDVTLSLEERDVGGLGIFMVKKSMDEINYENSGGQNVLSIVKYI